MPEARCGRNWFRGKGITRARQLGPFTVGRCTRGTPVCGGDESDDADEIGRRTDVVGIFPDNVSVIRLVSMLAIQANDEWLVGRPYISKESMALLDATAEREALPDKQDQQEVAELIAA